MINKKYAIFLLSLIILITTLSAVNAADNTTQEILTDTISAENTQTATMTESNVEKANDNNIIEQKDNKIDENIKEKNIKQYNKKNLLCDSSSQEYENITIEANNTYYHMVGNGSVFNNQTYYIGDIYHIVDDENWESLDIPINVTVNGETSSIEFLDAITLYYSQYDSDNPLFNRPGDNNITISFNDTRCGYFNLSIVLTTLKGENKYVMINNGSYLNNSYDIGYLISQVGNDSSNMISFSYFPINLTVNGETHQTITGHDGISNVALVINDELFSSDNPIFTTVGDNNITISFNDSKYGEFSTDIIYTTTGRGNVKYGEPYLNCSYLSDSYYIGELIYGNEDINEYLVNVPLNVTVNGENHEIETTNYGDIRIENTIFSNNNHIFTTVGENNITLSLINHEKYGNYTNDIVFTTVEPSLIVDELKEKYENINFIDINWHIKSYTGDVTTLLYINDVEVYDYYGWAQDDYMHDMQNYSYRFVPETPGNYTIKVLVSGDQGNLNYTKTFEVTSINPQLKLNITLDYNETAYYGQTVHVYGKVIDENGNPYTGTIKSEGYIYNYYSIEDDGTFYIELPTTQVAWFDNPIICTLIADNEYYEYTESIINITLLEKTLNDTNLNLILDKINDTEYDYPIILNGILLDSNDTPVTGAKITFDDDESNSITIYTDDEGKIYNYWNIYPSIGEHNLTATIETSNGNYTYNTTFNTIKCSPYISIETYKDLYDIHSLVINGRVYDYYQYIDHTIYIKVNNQTYSTTFDNSWEIKLPVTDTGYYNIEAYLPEDEYNNQAQQTATIYVHSINYTKIPAQIQMNVEYNTIYDSSIINLILTDENGSSITYTNINISISGGSYNENYTIFTNWDGEASLELTLPQENYHIQAVIDDIDYEYIPAEEDFTITIPNFDELTYVSTANNTPLSSYYSIGYLAVDGEITPNLSLNLTVNGETQTVTLDINDNHNIVIRDTIFDKNNPIFTTFGDNNITLQLNGEDYKTFIVNTVFTTKQADIIYNMYNNNSIFNKHAYNIGELSYVIDDYTRYLTEEEINLTVNGETHTINTSYYGGIYITNEVFSKENPIFTKYGNNNITISVNNKNVAFTEDIIFTTLNNNYTITIDKIESVSINTSTMISGYLYNPNNETVDYTYITLTINNETFVVQTDYDGFYSYYYTPTEAGRYNVTASYEDSNYDIHTNASRYFYGKTPIEITITNTTPIVNQTFNVTVTIKNPLDYSINYSNARVTITIDNQTYVQRTNDDGNIIINFTSNREGLLNVTASFAGSDRYEANSTNTLLYVMPKTSTDYIKQLEDLIKQLNKTVQDQNKTIKDLNNTVKNQNNTIKDLNNTIKTQNNTIQDQNNTIKDLNNTIKDLNKTIQNQNNTIKDLNNTVKNQNNTIKDLNNTIKTQNNTIKDLNNTVKTQNNTINDLNNTVKTQNNTIKDLNNTVKTQNNTINDLNSTVKSQNTTINNLNNTVKTQNNTINDLNKTVQNQNKTINNLNNTVKSQNNTIKDLNNSVKTQNSTINDLNNTVKAQNNTIKDLNNTVKTQNNTIKDLNNTIKTQNNTIKTQNNTIKDLNNTVKNQNTTINDLNNTIKTQNNTIKDLNKTIQNQNNTIKDLNNTIKTQNNTIKDLNNTVKSQNTTIKNLNTSLNNAQKENNNLKDTNNQLNNQVSALQKQLDQQKANNTKLATSITIDPVKSTVGDVASLTSRIVDEKGNNVNKGYVIYKINGLTLKDADGNILYAKVNNGVATLKYQVPKGWTKNTTEITAVYFAYDKYKESKINKTGILNISNGVAKVKIADMPVHKNGDNTQFVITVTDAKGNPLNGGAVIVKANGVTLKDEKGKPIQAKVVNGVAIIDYKIALGARVHTITAIYANTGYNRVEASNNLTVTKGEVFIRYEPVTTKTNYTLITGTIVDKTKQPIYTNVTVGIKIDGKAVATTQAVNGLINVTVPTSLTLGVHNIQLSVGETGAYKSDRLTSVIIKE